MASHAGQQNGSHEEQSDVQTFPLFENYLKMVRFNTSEVELQRMCSVPIIDRSLLTAPADAKLLDDDSLSIDDNEYILQTLQGDSDFSETVSDFSAISLTQNYKRKKPRSERWKRRNTSDLNARRVCPNGQINHKTIITQHESHRTSRSQSKERRSRSRDGSISRSVSRGSGNKDNPSTGMRTPTRSPDGGSNTPTPRNEINKAKPSGWSSHLETNSIDSSPTEVGERERSRKRCKKKRQQTAVVNVNKRKEKRIHSSDDLEDERFLGRNMRAVARRSSRKLRT